jgi:hypothetical protein
MTVAVSAPYPQRDLPEGSWFGDRDRKFCSGQFCWSTVLRENLIVAHLVEEIRLSFGNLTIYDRDHSNRPTAEPAGPPLTPSYPFFFF